MTLPSIAYLRTRLSYDKETGSLVWLPRPSSDFTKKHHFASWVSRCEGKEAGVIVTKKRKKYRRIDICGQKIYAHRIAWAIHYGEHPGEEIDHINGDSLDNSIANLRQVSHQENCKNVKLQAGSRSGYCGVSWHEETGKWRARVKINGKEQHIGLFDDPQEAAERIKTLRQALGFHSSHGSLLRTPEQIAAEEREKAVGDMAMSIQGVPYQYPTLYALFDAGYRRQEEGK
ncbi:TPA: HNH endonuclease [Pseudomonas aeruginosa]|uniref:HNH endonuclease n=1 Tax=Pseudomonas aeruginosa TaxID=287 RepID=UPI0015E30171|nr:HNH endonuclease [Pseudomonas aeruginosa]EKV5776919.1 HNH endonuclease [Pseudomonas aeruginosa]EKX2265345.1 HNH endonuclease [Pseudomonas aeruginosa]EKX3033508.1 HNH endonuclease [Pseudomonas aeruginosa]EKX3045781.1 HNH endonuclease [Pseudomonas aeruginosa]EKX3063891.1 HNH endonuclease [Pseudomonas aeruginosa]